MQGNLIVFKQLIQSLNCQAHARNGIVLAGSVAMLTITVTAVEFRLSLLDLPCSMNVFQFVR